MDVEGGLPGGGEKVGVLFEDMALQVVKARLGVVEVKRWRISQRIWQVCLFPCQQLDSSLLLTVLGKEGKSATEAGREEGVLFQ